MKAKRNCSPEILFWCFLIFLLLAYGNTGNAKEEFVIIPPPVESSFFHVQDDDGDILIIHEDGRITGEGDRVIGTLTESERKRFLKIFDNFWPKLEID